jgi:hypothetical protein
MNTGVSKQRLKNHKGMLKRVKIVMELIYRLDHNGTEGLKD